MACDNWMILTIQKVMKSKVLGWHIQTGHTMCLKDQQAIETCKMLVVA